jgi:hypothetical protein
MEYNRIFAAKKTRYMTYDFGSTRKMDMNKRGRSEMKLHDFTTSPSI